VELLQGRFSKGVMERLCRQDTGLFPRPSEIRFTCSCSDYASMCKHIAAVLYGVGARLDESPELLFRLRAVDETELLSDLGSALPDTRTKRDTAQTLVGDDLAALFGLDMEESKAPAPSRSADATSAGPPTKSAAKPATAKPSAGIRKAQAKATVSARRRSDSVPVIAAPVPVSQFSSRRRVRSSAAPKPANSAKRRPREGDG
jgi:uncharacterized Zn finger protein